MNGAMSKRLSVLLLLYCVMFLGCGGADSGGVDVSGTVTLDGKPLADVEVYFVNKKFEGYGKTDENGHYQLVNGAIAGSNKVYFMKTDTGGGESGGDIDMSIEGMDEGQAEANLNLEVTAGKNPKGLIPAEYNSAETTKLTFPVPEGGADNADFKLTGN